MSGVLGRIMGVLTDIDSPFEVESYSISGSGLILGRAGAADDCR